MAPHGCGNGPSPTSLKALNGLGADIGDLGTGCPPVTIQASGLDGGYAFVKGDVSSQFLSGLLMALPYAREMTTVEVQGTLVSQPYVTMTLAVMDEFGVAAENRKFRRFDVHPARYRGREYAIEPDASAASYFFAAGGDHRRYRSRSRAWAARVCRATWLSWTSSSTWAVRSHASLDARPSPAAGSAPSTWT